MLCGDADGEEIEKRRMYVYVSWAHFTVQYKLTQRGKATILQLERKTAPHKWPPVSDPLASSILNTVPSIAKQNGGWRIHTLDRASVCPADGDWLLSCDTSWGQVDMGTGELR